MRKSLLLLLLLLPFTLSAQSRFGYYSSSRVLESLPEYKQASKEYDRLLQRCEKEIEHNEKELTRQYVAFLNGQRDFPEPILHKRQSDLQRQVDSSVSFRQQLKSWLAEAKDSLYSSSYRSVSEAVEKICVTCKLDYAIDSDNAAYTYINPTSGADITAMILDAAKYPDKPINELDGYADFAKKYMQAPALTIVPESKVPSNEHKEEPSPAQPITTVATEDEDADGVVLAVDNVSESAHNTVQNVAVEEDDASSAEEADAAATSNQSFDAATVAAADACVNGDSVIAKNIETTLDVVNDSIQ